MQNSKSTIAMRLAHKMHAKWPKASFKACLKHAWKIVRIDITIAQRILLGTYNMRITKHKTMYGAVNAVQIVERGLLKRIFGKHIVTNISLWSGFINEY